MALTIRLRKQGRKNRAHFRVVVTESRNKRDGKYVEAIGWYDPQGKEAEKNLMLKNDRVQHWIEQGAQVSERVNSLIAKGAPEVARFKTEREVAHRAKEAAKRKARKQKKEG